MTSLFLLVLLAAAGYCSTLTDRHNANAIKTSRGLDKISGGEYIRALHQLGNRHLDKLAGGEYLRSLNPAEQLNTRTLDKIGSGEYIRSLGPYQAFPNTRALDRLSGGEFLRSLGYKRGLDSLSGMTFGNSKRFDSLSGLTFGDQHNKKRWYGHGDFDEIDNVGWPGFTKRQNFDEIDRTGFEGFDKRALGSVVSEDQ
ncbi:uncharacterized protein LOC135370563 [Ornithodoros turicata]|uniref:uncharacterized protein LOC135370563 n=1 Tax=Ornithodoros turicata TaxID=34597 RepID=UPI0031387B5E